MKHVLNIGGEGDVLTVKSHFQSEVKFCSLLVKEPYWVLSVEETSTCVRRERFGWLIKITFGESELTELTEGFRS